MNKKLLDHISYLLCVKVLNVSPLQGGAISMVYLLETETERFVCKMNETDSALKLFQCEREGLEAIAETKTIATPKVYHCEAMEKGAFLLMEYLESKRPVPKDMELLGHHLAAMHTNSAKKRFGWDAQNYIGSLIQPNDASAQWPPFYIEQRLWPQLKLAQGNSLLMAEEIPSKETLLKRCSALVGTDVRPVLLHGDLWGGNFLIGLNGVPYLIDPAVYYGHSEVDLAMTKLFGGFSNRFYDAYYEHLAVPGNTKELTGLYQLYYLLVHLNLFGKAYYGQVIALLKRLFR